MYCLSGGRRIFRSQLLIFKIQIGPCKPVYSVQSAQNASVHSSLFFFSFPSVRARCSLYFSLTFNAVPTMADIRELTVHTCALGSVNQNHPSKGLMALLSFCCTGKRSVVAMGRIAVHLRAQIILKRRNFTLIVKSATCRCRNVHEKNGNHDHDCLAWRAECLPIMVMVAMTMTS